MNEREATDLLDRLASQVPVGPPPVDGLLASGQHGWRRRRGYQVAGTAVAVAAVVAFGFVLRPDATSQPTQTPAATSEGGDVDRSDGGVVTVPLVVGLRVQEAVQALEATGLSVDIQPTACTGNDECLQYRVQSMNPAPGEVVDIGSTVLIRIDEPSVLDSIEGLTGVDVGLALGLKPITDPVIHGCGAFAEYAEGTGFCIDGITDDEREEQIILQQITGKLSADHPFSEHPGAGDVQGAWQVKIAGVERNGHSIIDTYRDVLMSMTFTGNELSFDDGCNTYAGEFTLIAGNFDAVAHRTTANPCPPQPPPLAQLVAAARHATIADGHLYLHAESFQILLSLTPVASAP